MVKLQEPIVQRQKFEKTITATNFDNENKLFFVDGLIPGQYQVTLTNVANPSIQLISPILDMTKGWKSFDFEYRAPLSVEINSYMVKQEKVTLPVKDLKLEDYDLLQRPCGNDYYVLEEGSKVIIQAIVFEKYGENKCYIPNADVTFTGELLKLPDGATSVNSKTDDNGRAVLLFICCFAKFYSTSYKKLYYPSQKR